MQQIFNFVIRNKTFLLFLLLFGIALSLTIQSHSYHKSQFINSANSLTGGVYGTVNSIGQYFDLKEQNSILVEENKLLREQLLNTNKVSQNIIDNSSFNDEQFDIISAEVYKNSYDSPNNYLTINRGLRDSIQQDFGVITSKGIVGIIDNTSNKYSTVLSILSKKSRINAKLKSSNQSGSLTWDTNSPYFAQLEDVSKFAKLNIGDTIVTGGQSAIFPKGIEIGKVEEFTTDTGGDTYTIQVRLFNDMTTLQHVYIIKNNDIEELKTLEELNNE
ncbi:rod shape-determining protein MreC [Winogradskyella sp. PC-19]|uniref:rod shape-determining protein MreC n=1 Tax=unclassified Winogradskyella TaxID=2615021 RepID=UPI000B3C6B51|nr:MULTISPECIES: rod shape-determining protein MreC [unclassified Winogradskyella]ARV10300.1 rod shape-determining protein MreC [Winogradskyella sp. PC-19]RZN81488.1 MAG: rod shape-determining protein MreC [Winogradskyella sp.]